MSDVIWPRHADGNCDYDTNGNMAASASDKQAMADTSAENTAIQKPAPALGKTAVVTENLRLRTDDKATAEVVTTLAAGTRVKVLAPGREDTIDGIASNWAQVEVLGDAKDKDGNAIAADTTGWLFGGYLSESEKATLPESAESERPNEKADAKKSAAPPVVPIAAGGVAFAVLLGVVLLAARKRKPAKTRLFP